MDRVGVPTVGGGDAGGRGDIPCDAPTPTAIWNRVAEDWIETDRQLLWRRHNNAVMAGLLSRWVEPGADRVLKTDLFEEACGDGVYPEIERLAAEVHGIDIAESVASAAASRHPAMRVCVADVRSLPFADGAFSMVFSPSTLDHFESVTDIHRALRELRRVTADDGRLIITLDNPVNPKIALRNALPRLAMKRVGLSPYPYGATLSRRALAGALESAGFGVVREAAVLHCPRVLAVAAAQRIQGLESPATERRFLSTLRYWEALERLPTRWLTAHYTAVLARAVA